MIDTAQPWMGSTVRQSPATTLAAHEQQIQKRAYLYARLGLPKKTAEQKLTAALAWEFERVGKPAVAKKVSGLVSAAYKLAGPGKKV